MNPIIETIAGYDVYRLENNEGVIWDDVLRAAKSPNKAPVRLLGERVLAQGGVFSNIELMVAMETGHVICDPPPQNVAGSSIDTTIGHYFYRTGVDDHGKNSIFNPFDEQSTLEYFGDAQEAEPASTVIKRLGEQAIHRATLDALQAYPPDHPVISMAPRERILAHTNEFIGIRSPGTTSMQSRSTTGRVGWASCLCAGWGDPGYINRWTMEVYNFNHRWVLIPEGYRMAQITMFSTGPVSSEYSKMTGKYQTVGSDNLETLKGVWQPSFILPRAYKDPIKSPSVVSGLREGLI